jgi:hypothetical protein
VLGTLSVSHRKSHNSRHSYVSWRLMAGHNRLLVAQEDGHSVEIKIEILDDLARFWLPDAPASKARAGYTSASDAESPRALTV